MIKRIIIVFLLISLSSCWSSSVTTDTTTETTSLISHDAWDFVLDIPSSWEIKDLTNTWSINLPKPKEGKLALVVSSKDEKRGFMNNLIVVSKDLDQITNTYDFITKNNPKDYKWYVYYYEDTVKDFEFSDWDKTKLYIFIAKYNKDNDKLKFMQTAKICWEKKSFFLTIGLSLDINDTAKYEEIFRSFKCD